LQAFCATKQCGEIGFRNPLMGPCFQIVTCLFQHCATMLIATSKGHSLLEVRVFLNLSLGFKLHLLLGTMIPLFTIWTYCKISRFYKLKYYVCLFYYKTSMLSQDFSFMLDEPLASLKFLALNLQEMDGAYLGRKLLPWFF
jgi:hypothetical protein